MDRSETLRILAVLKAAYPNFYKDMNRGEGEGIVSLWTEMFSDEPYQLVAAAVKALITSSPNPFPPVIGQVKEKMQQLTKPDVMTEQEAWNRVFVCLNRCGYNYVEEFDRLPQDIKQVVSSPSQLHEWAMMDTPTLQSVVASNFMRSYRARAAANREYMRLPSDVREFVSRLGTGMDIKQLEG